MARLIGAQKLVLQAILNIQGDSPNFVEDSQIAQSTRIALKDVRDWCETLEGEGYVDVARTETSLSVSITAKGKLVLKQFQPIGTPPSPTSPPPSGEGEAGRTNKRIQPGLALSIVGLTHHALPVNLLYVCFTVFCTLVVAAGLAIRYALDTARYGSVLGVMTGICTLLLAGVLWVAVEWAFPSGDPLLGETLLPHGIACSTQAQSAQAAHQSRSIMGYNPSTTNPLDREGRLQ
jgi:predicted transcriptional regulator